MGRGEKSRQQDSPAHSPNCSKHDAGSSQQGRDRNPESHATPQESSPCRKARDIPPFTCSGVEGRCKDGTGGFSSHTKHAVPLPWDTTPLPPSVSGLGAFISLPVKYLSNFRTYLKAHFYAQYAQHMGRMKNTSDKRHVL